MSKRLNYYEAAPEGAKALRVAHGYVDQCGLPKTLIDLVYLRISQINGCAYCVDHHTRDLLKNGMPQEKITVLPVWYEVGPVFDARERAALAWAESLTNVSHTHAPDADYEAAAKVFNDKELADLTIAISLMNAYNRLGIGFRMPPKVLVDLQQA